MCFFSVTSVSPSLTPEDCFHIECADLKSVVNIHTAHTALLPHSSKVLCLTPQVFSGYFGFLPHECVFVVCLNMSAM